MNDGQSGTRDRVLERWRALVVASYPPDTARLLLTEKDRFANPVGHALSTGMEAIYDGLVAGVDAEDMARRLDGIVRVRAVQEFKPSEALSFVFLLKRAVRDVPGAPDRIPDLDARIDGAALVAFDLYVACREKVYEIRANEVRRRTWKLLERAGFADPGASADPNGGIEK